MVSQEELKALFKYDPETGDLLRLSNGRTVRSVTKTGYCRVNIGGTIYKTHRVIWMLVHGEMPDQVDHINGDRSDNRISNLRNISKYENTRNQKRHPGNTSGCSGVNWNARLRKWVAQIRDHGKYVYLGGFQSLDEAIAVRKDAEKRLGYHPNHGSLRKRYERD